MRCALGEGLPHAGGLAAPVQRVRVALGHLRRGVGRLPGPEARGKPFTVVGDVTRTRDVTLVRDAVDAYVAAVQSDVGGELFNVGAGRPVSINRFIKLLGGDVVHIAKRPGEPDCTYAEIGEIVGRLGWQPKPSLHPPAASSRCSPA